MDFLVVFLLGCLVGVAEIVSTFRKSPVYALKTGWALLLIALNGGAAALALWLVKEFTPAQMNPALRAVLVGLGFPTIIRTKFTLARQMFATGENAEEVALNLGWLYEQFQNLCKVQIDLSLVSMRDKWLRKLLSVYPEDTRVNELARLAEALIRERALFTKQDVKRYQDYIDEVVNSSLTEATKAITLARLVLDVTGPEYIKTLVKTQSSKGTGGSDEWTVSDAQRRRSPG